MNCFFKKFSFLLSSGLFILNTINVNANAINIDPFNWSKPYEKYGGCLTVADSPQLKKELAYVLIVGDATRHILFMKINGKLRSFSVVEKDISSDKYFYRWNFDGYNAEMYKTQKIQTHLESDSSSTQGILHIYSSKYNYSKLIKVSIRTAC